MEQTFTSTRNLMTAKKNSSAKNHADLEMDAEHATDPDYFCKVGVQKFNGGDYAGAILDFDKALTLDPENAEYYNLRGHAKFSKGESKGARADFSKSKKLKAKSKKVKKIIPL